MDYIIKRSRKYRGVSVVITSNGNVEVRAGERVGQELIEKTLASCEKELNDAFKKHGRQIEHGKKRAENLKKYEIPKKDAELYRKKTEAIVEKKVKYWSDKMGLSPESVKITLADKRYGSCSYKNRLCFSYKLAVFPEKATDYVVIHELAHIKYKNHSKEFYSFVSSYMPDYMTAEAILKGDRQ